MRCQLLLLVPGSALLGWWLVSGEAPDTNPTRHPQTLTSAASAPEQRPSTSQDTDAQGQSDKTFELHFGLKAAFDKFIFGHPDLSQQQLTDAYVDSLRQQQYNDAAQDKAASLFSRYLEYKAALAEVDVAANAQQLDVVVHRLEARDDLRFRFFSDSEYHYLFSRDAAYDNAALARLRIAQDPDLSKAQKQRLIAEQLATLPEDQKASFAPSLAVNRLAALNQQYASDSTRYQAVSAEFGYEVAQRMAEREQQQHAWQQRVKDFLSWRSEILQRDGMSEEEKASMITRRRAAQFDETEQRRLQVFKENPALIN